MKQNGVSLVAITIAAITGGVISYLFLDPGRDKEAALSPAAAPAHKATDCAYTFARVEGFNRVRPLLYSEPLCESPRFESLRGSISAMVDGFKATGQVTSASVYVRDFKQGEWTWYNGDEPYDPGSMLKVALLLTYLSMSEEDPGLMKRTWTCEKVDFDVPQVTAFPSMQVGANVSYTVAQLLEYMIIHSDNRATTMLLRHVSPARYIKTYTDLGLPAPEQRGNRYQMNVRDYSVFMKALYNSSLLGPLDSERALEMMTRADFNKGLVAGLPTGIDIAHKFGEAGDDKEKQLHETGLVYAEGNPYLITVMTRGTNVDSLASAISSVSRLVYERMRVH